MSNSNGQVKGLGLGLFYVKQAIDAHNWKIDIESVEGEGSAFIISIPFKNQFYEIENNISGRRDRLRKRGETIPGNIDFEVDWVQNGKMAFEQ